MKSITTVATITDLIKAGACRSWQQVAIRTAVTRGQKKLPYLPLYVEKFLGSSWVQQLSDRQHRGYTTLIFRLWDSDLPGFLPRRPESLWRAAGYGSIADFEADWAVLAERFETTMDGGFIFNRKVLHCYAEQLPKYLGRAEKARKAAIDRWKQGTRKDAPSSARSTASSNAPGVYNHNHIQNHNQRGTDPRVPVDPPRVEGKPCAAASAAPPVILLPLNQGDHGVAEADVAEWQTLYPAVDVMQELREMRGWLQANPKRRKTKTGINRFVNSWLAREQDGAGGKRSPVGVSTNGTDKTKTIVANVSAALERKRARRVAGEEAGDVTERVPEPAIVN